VANWNDQYQNRTILIPEYFCCHNFNGEIIVTKLKNERSMPNCSYLGHNGTHFVCSILFSNTINSLLIILGH